METASSTQPVQHTWMRISKSPYLCSRGVNRSHPRCAVPGFPAPCKDCGAEIGQGRPALEIFSRYGSVEKASGEVVTLTEYLEQVWGAVSKEALAMIFTGADATGFEEDARLTAMWLWTISTAASNEKGNGTSTAEDEKPGEDEEDGSANAKSKVGGFVLEYDAARKIAQGLGAHLEQLASLIEVKGSTARLLPVAERTRSLFQKGDAAEPIGRGKAKKKSAQLSLG